LSLVSEVETSEIEQMYGGDNKPSGPNASSTEASGTNAADAAKQRLAQTTHFSTNAYMLMYRLVDPSTNLNGIPDSEVQ